MSVGMNIAILGVVLAMSLLGIGHRLARIADALERIASKDRP